MLAEIISIGDELTSGKILDSNAQWLSRELANLGIRVLFHTTVGDELQANIEVFRAAARRVDLIVATGGLGPTADDLTRESLAEMLNVPLVKDEKALEHIRNLFLRRSREMPLSNENQALYPDGGKTIFNPNGTAPGIEITVSRKQIAEFAGEFEKSPDSLLDVFRIIALPGVPVELRDMWKHSVRDSILEFCEAQSGAKRTILFRSLHAFGAGESQIEAMLPDLIRRSHSPTVGITADLATISLRIRCESSSPEECREQMEPTERLIREKLGTLLYGEEEQTLADVVIQRLQAEGKTLAVMEWGTRGILCNTLSRCENADRCFLGGEVIRSPKFLAQKASRFFPGTGFANLPQSPAELVSLMLRITLEEFGTDYAFAIGPYPDSNISVPGVFLGWGRKIPRSAPEGWGGEEFSCTVIESQPFGSDPAVLDTFHSKKVMNLFRLSRDNEST